MFEHFTEHARRVLELEGLEAHARAVAVRLERWRES